MAQPNESDDEAVLWSITGVPFHEQPELSLFGELMVHTETAVVAVTVHTMIDYQGQQAPFAPEDEEGVQAEVERAGSKLTHIMWDAAAMFARQLVAGTGLDIEVPSSTPDVKYGVAVFDDEEGEAEAELSVVEASAQPDR